MSTEIQFSISDGRRGFDGRLYGGIKTFPQLGVLLSLSILASDLAPLLCPSVSVRLKPIVGQAMGMNVMVTPLLFSLSIKSKMAQTQLTVRLSGTPPLYLFRVSHIKPTT